MPVRDEQGLYERISLEAFQAGLSWATILRKRPAFRAAFRDFRAGHRRRVHRRRRRAADGRRRDRAQPRSRSARPSPTPRPPSRCGTKAVWSTSSGPSSPRQTPAPATYDDVPTHVAGIGRAVQGAAPARLRVRRAHHHVRPDGGHRDGGHPPGGQPPARQLRGLAPTLTPSTPSAQARGPSNSVARRTACGVNQHHGQSVPAEGVGQLPGTLRNAPPLRPLPLLCQWGVCSSHVSAAQAVNTLRPRQCQKSFQEPAMAVDISNTRARPTEPVVVRGPKAPSSSGGLPRRTTRPSATCT